MFLISSCSDPAKKEYEKNVKMITATAWQYDVEAIREAAKTTLKTNQEEDLMNNALARLDSAAFIFNEDGTMLLKMPKREVPGDWELSEDSKEFYILIGGASIYPNPVTSIGPNRIALGTDLEKGIIFPKIFKPFELSE